MIKTHHRKTVERQIFNKMAKSVFDGVKRMEVIQMLWINICDDRHISWQFQKSAIAFICLHNHPFASAQTRVGAISVYDAAIDNGWI